VKEIENYYAESYPTPYEMVKRKDCKKGTAVKCDFCFERLGKGRLPACVETCPGLARIFGDLDDPNSDASKLLEKHKAVSLKEDEGTEPSVCYIRP
jgi:Fe-S-cluster-containing dehydrogenase component